MKIFWWKLKFPMIVKVMIPPYILETTKKLISSPEDAEGGHEDFWNYERQLKL